jgi:hypothetical protein
VYAALAVAGQAVQTIQPLRAGQEADIAGEVHGELHGPALVQIRDVLRREAEAPQLADRQGDVVLTELVGQPAPLFHVSERQHRFAGRGEFRFHHHSFRRDRHHSTSEPAWAVMKLYATSRSSALKPAFTGFGITGPMTGPNSSLGQPRSVARMVP